MSATVLGIIGNPRPESRTHRLARALVAEVCGVLAGASDAEVDLARLGGRVLDAGDATVSAEVERVLAADVLVVVSPVYKASYTGLLKAFLDRLATGALDGVPAVPLLLGGSADHRLAVDVHLTPLLLELGARVPARGLYVLESELDTFGERAAAFAESIGPLLAPESRARARTETQEATVLGAPTA